MNTAIPEKLMALLSGEQLEAKQHEAFILQTVNEDGWPHSAMISVGEVIAIDDFTFRIALWPGTMTTMNLIRSEKAQLVIVHEGLVYYVKLKTKHLSPQNADVHTRERFTAHIHALKIDEAKYAEIQSGIKVRLYDPNTVIERWQSQIESLKQN